jgi:hypothetical protein
MCVFYLILFSSCVVFLRVFCYFLAFAFVCLLTCNTHWIIQCSRMLKYSIMNRFHYTFFILLEGNIYRVSITDNWKHAHDIYRTAGSGSIWSRAEISNFGAAVLVHFSASSNTHTHTLWLVPAQNWTKAQNHWISGLCPSPVILNN